MKPVLLALVLLWAWWAVGEMGYQDALAAEKAYCILRSDYEGVDVCADDDN